MAGHRKSLEGTWQFLEAQGYDPPVDPAGRPFVLGRMPKADEDDEGDSDEKGAVGLSFFRTMVRDARLDGLTMPRTFFERSNIERTSFRDTDLHESRLCWNDWTDCDFEGADLAGADLRASIYERCRFVRANLAGADLRQSSFIGCDFTDSVLRGAKLTDDHGSKLDLNAHQRAVIAWQADDGPEPSGG